MSERYVSSSVRSSTGGSAQTLGDTFRFCCVRSSRRTTRPWRPWPKPLKRTCSSHIWMTTREGTRRNPLFAFTHPVLCVADLLSHLSSSPATSLTPCFQSPTSPEKRLFCRVRPRLFTAPHSEWNTPLSGRANAAALCFQATRVTTST